MNRVISRLFKYIEHKHLSTGVNHCFNYLQGSDIEDEEMEELLNDTRLLKRLKKGKISEEEFEKRLLSSERKVKAVVDSESED